MADRIPQSATIRIPLYAVLASDHIAPATGKTIAITISKNGAAFGNPSGGATNATEIGSGWYYFDASTTDTGTLGPLIVHGAVATVDNVDIAYEVVNATTGGWTNLDAAVSSRMATYTQPTGFLAATFPASVASPTNITAGVITTVTNLTNAPTAGDLTATMKASVTAAVPTVAAIRTEMDSNSTKLANLDATISSRTKPADTQAAVTLVTTTTNLTNLPAAAALEATLTTMKGATFNGATDSLEAIRDRGDAAWTTPAGFSTHSAADVWAVGTRRLTDGTNIVLAKGTGVTGFNDLSAAQVNTEADQALADYDGPTHAEMTAELASADDAVLVAIDALPTAVENRAEMDANSTKLTSINNKTINLPASPASTADVAAVVTVVTTVGDNVTNFRCRFPAEAPPPRQPGPRPPM